MKKINALKKLLAALCLIIGMGAVGGALSMFIDPTGKFTGMSSLLTDLQKLPFADIFFQNLIFPAVVLLVIIGITNIVTFVYLIQKHKNSALLGVICGVILMLWIIIQFVIFPFNAWSTIYFILGFVQLNAGIGLITSTKNRYKNDI